MQMKLSYVLPNFGHFDLSPLEVARNTTILVLAAVWSVWFLQLTADVGFPEATSAQVAMGNLILMMMLAAGAFVLTGLAFVILREYGLIPVLFLVAPITLVWSLAWPFYAVAGYIVHFLINGIVNP